MPLRRRTRSLEKQVQQQLAALQTQTQRSLKALDKAYPNRSRSTAILHQHQQRVQNIVQPVKKSRKPRAVYPSREICNVCGKPLYEAVDHWTDSLVLKLLWAVGVTGVFWLIGFFFGWVTVFVPLVAWAVSFSFLWSITVPTVLFLVVLLTISLVGL
jgi:hypothetical protein